MEQINIKEIIENTLYKKFKKYEGKIFKKKDSKYFWLIKEVYMVNGKAKMKFLGYDYIKNKWTTNQTWNEIKNLLPEWEVLSKTELDKVLILNNL